MDFTSRPVAGLGLNGPMKKELSRRYRLSCLPEDIDPASEVLVVQKGAVNLAVLEKLPMLKMISTSAAGTDNIDPKLLLPRGIMLTNRQGNSCTADLAMALLLAAARRICFFDRHVRDGRWKDELPGHLTRISAKKLGIFGLGNIGLDVCKRAAGFDMEIGYHNRRPRNGVNFKYFPSLEALAEWADYLVIASPLTEETRYRVNKRVLEALGPHGILINIARGPIVDEAALIDALESGLLGGAGLDVYENEPQIPPRLLALDNVVLSPHLGGYTVETQIDGLNEVIENIESFFRSGKPVVAVDLERYA